MPAATAGMPRAGSRNWRASCDRVRQLPEYLPYDCRIGYPLEELEKRIAVLGAEHAYVKQWLKVQLAVFAACGGADISELPPPLDMKDDLAADPGGGSRLSASQLDLLQGSAQVARPCSGRLALQNRRTGRRRATWSPISWPMPSKLDEARNEARAILADNSLASVHEITQELLGYIANLEDTAAGWSDLLNETITVIETPAADILASPKLKADYARALYDIDFVGIRVKRGRLVARWQASGKSDDFQGDRRCFARTGDRALDDRRPDGR